MSGRIFRDSSGTDEDQARILLDYLLDVARKIIAEEERLDAEIAQCSSDRAVHESAKRNATIRLWIAVGVAGLMAVGALIYSLLILIGTVAVLSYTVFEWINVRKFNDLVSSIESQIEELNLSRNAIKRDHQVQRLGIAYVPVATRIPYEGGSVLVDHSGSVKDKEFSLNLVRDQEAFVSNIKALEESVSSMPMVEGMNASEEVDTSQYSCSVQNITYGDYLGNLDRSMRASDFLLSDFEHLTVKIPVAIPGSDFDKKLADHGSQVTSEAPIVSVFSIDSQNDAIDAFARLSAMRLTMERSTLAFEDFLYSLMERLATTVQLVTKAKLASTTSLTSQGNRILYTTLKASYNHYSPQLEAQEIERISSQSFDYQSSAETYRPFELRQSSKVRYDVVAENWVSEDGKRTVVPFGVHQIQEEVIAPVVEALMKETRMERLRIYESIKDQKLDYLNQWHRDTDDFYARNRAEGNNLINLMQASLTDFITAFNQYEAFEKSRKSMETGNDAVGALSEGSDAASILTYRHKMDSFLAQQTEFNAFAERLKDEISEYAIQFGYIENYDASLRDRPAHDYAVALATMDTLDDRRRPLTSINAYFAAMADLPPSPDVDPVVQLVLASDLREQASMLLGNRPVSSGDGLSPTSDPKSEGEAVL